jgi:hypothetical protein
MALETSGTLSIGGTTTNRSINVELGRSATATSSLGETDLRDLAGVASGAIAIDDFYGASSVYEIENSLKLEPDNSEFLSITNTSAGNRRTATYSFWLKRTELDASSYMQVAGLSTTSETVRFMFYQDRIMLENGNGGTRKRLTTNALYRDTSAWYHFVVAIDTTQSTAANRVKLYVNGVQETSFLTEEYPAQNFDLSIGQSGPNFPWRYGAYDATYYKTAGYLAEAHYIDGTQYAASDFGEFDEDSGIWKPKEFTGTYGTQGSYFNFSAANNLGANPKGSDIDAVLNNITAADQATDTPTNNFCTLNPVYQAQATKYHTVSNGGTFVTGNQGGTVWDAVAATIPLFKGKWYWEIKKNGTVAQTNMLVGVGGIDEHLWNWRTLTTITDGARLMFSYNGVFYGGGSGGFSYNDGDIVSIALDQDNGGFYLRKNGGTWTNSGNPASGSSLTGAQTTPWGTSIPAFNVANNVGGLALNFGGFSGFTISSGNTDANGYGNFEYAPPSGYYAICTKNLAEHG